MPMLYFNMNAVEINQISKSYGKDNTKALNAITFSVKQGELFGLIGPDGAGKTSLFRILTTLLMPDSGEANVNGFDIVKDYKKIRNSIGYMPGKFSLYQDLTVEENLHFFATVFGTTIKENYHLIEDIYVQIEPFKNRRAGKLSGGMKQKLALCCALIHEPSVLFLDEPTTGVDPVSRKEFWEMLKRLKQKQITIMVSTPYMDEALMCDRIGLIQNGNMLAIDTPEKIIELYQNQLYEITAENTYYLLKDLRAMDNTATCYTFGEFLHLTFKNDSEHERLALLQTLKQAGHQAIQMKAITPTIEDCFIQLLKN